MSDNLEVPAESTSISRKYWDSIIVDEAQKNNTPSIKDLFQLVYNKNNDDNTSKYIDINQLKTKLTDHQNELNQATIDIFNNNYNEFINLSSIVGCLSDPVYKISQMVGDFNLKLSNLCKEHDVYLAGISKKMQILKDTNANSKIAFDIIKVSERLSIIETVLSNYDWNIKLKDMINSPSFKVNCDLLERTSLSLHYLLDDISDMHPTDNELLSIKTSLEVKLKRIQLQIDNWFEMFIIEANDEGHQEFIEFVKLTYSQRGLSAPKSYQKIEMNSEEDKS